MTGNILKSEGSQVRKIGRYHNCLSSLISLFHSLWEKFIKFTEIMSLNESSDLLQSNSRSGIEIIAKGEGKLF